MTHLRALAHCGKQRKRKYLASHLFYALAESGVRHLFLTCFTRWNGSRITVNCCAFTDSRSFSPDRTCIFILVQERSRTVESGRTYGKLSPSSEEHPMPFFNTQTIKTSPFDGLYVQYTKQTMRNIYFGKIKATILQVFVEVVKYFHLLISRFRGRIFS